MLQIEWRGEGRKRAAAAPLQATVWSQPDCPNAALDLSGREQPDEEEDGTNEQKEAE
jgi:hypothetical protein